MSWRPPENVWDKLLKDNNQWVDKNSVEAGADIMLEVIKSIGLNFIEYPYYMGCIDEFDYLRPFDGKKGWMVFIPDKEQSS